MAKWSAELAPSSAVTMLSHFLLDLLVALAAFTIVVSAGPGLSVRTSTSHAEVDGLENLKVTTTVINTGDETLELLNDPRGVLNSFPENSFSITSSVGSRPFFNGAKVNHPSDFLVNVCSCFWSLFPGHLQPCTRGWAR